jgi:outer membrane protein
MVLATSLRDVYQDALQHDPSFAKAAATWESAKLNLPLAMTGNGSPGSGLFPNISLNGGANRNYYDHFHTHNTVYGISVTQPIFNFATWESIKSAGFGVKAATAQYLASTQDLIKRVTTAYLEVLRAKENLTVVQAKKEQIQQQYKTTWDEYVAGVLAITPVYDAKAQYDQVVVEELKNQNQLENALANLKSITGMNYKHLNGLAEKIPLEMPRPNHLSEWSHIAEKQNYQLQSDLNIMLADQQNIKLAAAGMAPSLNMLGDYQRTSTKSSMPIQTGDPGPKETSVGLSMNFPIFRGGYDIVNTKKARYEYLSSSDQLEIDHRSIENQLQQTYNSINSLIKQIRADDQAILSANQQLSATQAGYDVGTRTLSDVLTSMTNLASSKSQYANDRVNYLESVINLKALAGTLSPDDLQSLDTHLTKPITF